MLFFLVYSGNMELPFGYQTEEQMLSPLEIQKIDAYALCKGGSGRNIFYKTAKSNAGNDLTQVLNSDTGSSTVTYSFNPGKDECICPSSIVARVVPQFILGTNAKWVMTADGVRPAGTDPTAAVAKPKIASCAATANGIRIPLFPVTSQLQWITTAVGQGETTLESASLGHNKMAVDWATYAQIAANVASYGTSANYIPGVVDGRVTNMDVHGNPYFTKTEVDTSSNAFIDEFYRLKDSTQSKTVFEKLFLRAFQGTDGDGVFGQGKAQASNMKWLPPGCPLSLNFSMKSSVDSARLKTGIVVSVGDGTAGGTFTDTQVYLTFKIVSLECQAVKLSEEELQDFFNDSILYSTTQPQELTLNSTAPLVMPMYKSAPIWKTTFTDISVQKLDIADGQTEVQWDILSFAGSQMPDCFIIFAADKGDPFSLAKVATTNWDLQSFVATPQKISKINVTTGSNNSKSPQFLDYLPGDDFDVTDANERRLLLDANTHQLVGKLIYEGMTYTNLQGQMGPALATWIRRGYTIAQLPGQNAFMFWRDLCSVVAADQADGNVQDTMSLNVTFGSAAASISLYCVLLRRSQVVLNTRRRPADGNNIEDATGAVTYEMNGAASGVCVKPTLAVLTSELTNV